MAERGDTFFNPVTQTRVTFVTPARDGCGRELVLDWFVPPGERLPAASHRHHGPDGVEVEFFEILAGEAGCKIGGQTLRAKALHTFAVLFNVAHVHPWNAGTTELYLRQSIRLPAPAADVLLGVEKFFETLIALSQQNRSNRKGDISNPLQGALTLSETLLPVTSLAGLPLPLQTAAFGSLASLARRLGYVGTMTPQRE